MLTATQSAKIRAVQGLIAAREALPPTSLVCFDRQHADSILAAIERIDWLISELLPNKPISQRRGDENEL